MIIHCEKCNTEFETDDTDSLSPANGSICPECGHISNIEASERGSESETAEIPEWDLEKLTGDGGNWEEFVNISKTAEEPEDLGISGPPEPEKQESDFNWENLSIDHEPEYEPDRTPAMFEDELEDKSEAGPGEGYEILPETTPETEPRPSAHRRETENLAVDTDLLTNNPYRHESFGAGGGHAPYETLRIHATGKNSGVFAKLVYALITIAVLMVIIAASFIILLNIGVIPKDSASKVRAIVESVIPVKLGAAPKNEVIITEHGGKWMDTRNGSLYVVSGMIMNKSEVPVNYIKIRSEFMAGGEVLYQSDTYAGNTFTDNELKVSPLQDILLKLQKKNGSINYYDTERLAGLNYDIQPGEFIPFYAIFPSTGRVLGLSYELQVEGYEDSQLD